MDMISKATRNEFREVLVGFVLREIDMIFEGAGFNPNLNYDPQISGERRTLVERYYIDIDFSSPTDIRKLLAAYEDIILRLKQSSAEESVKVLLRRMERDGYSFENERFIQIPSLQPPLVEAIRSYAASLDLEGLCSQIDRLAQAAENDPPLAVGTAKELVETICKTILEDRGVAADKEDMGKIVRAVSKELSLLPDTIPNNAKGSDVIRWVLSNLNQIAQGLAELRNLYGTGHGRSGRTRGIQPRHAKLAIGAATTLAVFLLETHLERDLRDPSS